MSKITVNGISVHYTDTGSGEPVVLVHSGGNSSGQWRGVAEALENRFRLLAIDLPGHGKTRPWAGPAPAGLDDLATPVLALAEAHGGSAHLVGHSFGGGVALRAALMAPERCKTLSLFEPNAFSLLQAAGEDALFAEASRHAEQDMADLARGARETMMERFVDFWNDAPGMWGGLPGHIREKLLQTAEGIVDGWRALLADSITLADLNAMTLPTLVLGGDRTHKTLERIAQIAAAEIPGASLIIIPGAGHMAPLTHPIPLAEALAAHMKGGSSKAEPRGPSQGNPKRLDRV
ncbi:MAG: alpha/beta hydrolase [bacterium]